MPFDNKFLETIEFGLQLEWGCDNVRKEDLGQPLGIKSTSGYIHTHTHTHTHIHTHTYTHTNKHQLNYNAINSLNNLKLLFISHCFNINIYLSI